MARAAWTLVLLLSSLWAAPALFWRAPLPAPWPGVAAAAWAVFALSAVALLWHDGGGGGARALLAYGVAFVLLLGWWSGHTLTALRSAGRITERARAAPADAGFSQAIRRGVPGTGVAP